MMMTKSYKATAEQWAYKEHYAIENACILELRSRIEALESVQRVRSGPESPLVERVADAIAEQATSAGIVNDRPARAAILEVARWLAKYSNSVTGQACAAQLEIEATND